LNSKKEVLAASILAISLAIGLGAMSYALFSAGPTAPSVVMDVFTQKGGQGTNTSGGSFQPFENVFIYAHVTQGGKNLQNCPVALTLQKPDGTQIVQTVITNDSGVAETDLSLLPSEGNIIGTWHVLANTTIDNKAVKDTVNFQCVSQSALIDVFAVKNGAPSISFLPNDTVLLEAQLSYPNASTAGIPVTFDVRTPNGTEFPSFPKNATTDTLGTANVTFQIPWPSDLSIGVWQAFVTSQVYGQNLNRTTSFGCYVTSPEIYLWTQKGGVPGAPGGSFVLNETVILYAEVKDELNQTVLNIDVAFSVLKPDGTRFVVEALAVNPTTGIASYPFRIPPDPTYVGTYQAYATARYEGLPLSDTLTFVVSQS
jgi:hypothetical protein